MTMEERMAQVEAQAAAKAAGAAQADTDLITGHLDVEQLKGMKMADLKALANDMGLKYPFNIKKDDLAVMIAAEPVQAEKAAIVPGDVDPEAAAEAADVQIVATDPAEAPEADAQDEDETAAEGLECTDVPMKGRVLVTYTGMVNLRDESLAVIDQAMQGQVFPVTGKREIEGVAWYRVEDRHGKECLISGAVVRYMA